MDTENPTIKNKRSSWHVSKTLFLDQSTSLLNKELIIEALFKNYENAHTTIRLGVVIDGVVYQASSSNAGGLASLTRVQLDFLNIPTGETLSDRLLQFCKYYGKVYQIKKHTTDGFFEGQISMMIDSTGMYEDDEGNQVPVKPLSRMLYLQAWNNFVPATFSRRATGMLLLSTGGTYQIQMLDFGQQGMLSLWRFGPYYPSLQR
ncbi:unnamed protein product [Rhizopus stolonifer]